MLARIETSQERRENGMSNTEGSHMDWSGMGKLDYREGTWENVPGLRCSSDPFQEKGKQELTYGVM